MAIEVEQKFAVEDVVALERRLTELGARAGETESQVDRYYAHPERDFARTDEALRLRRIGPANYFTYKGPKLDTTTKTREEVEISLASGDTAAADAGRLLEALGFRPVAEVRKTRRHYRLHSGEMEVSLSLDEVDGVGSFVELEIVTGEEQLDRARKAVAALGQRLGLANSERRSYLELLLARQAKGGASTS